MTETVPDLPLLVVDDDPAAVRTMRRLLDMNGYGSDGAASVSEARELLSQNSYALILCDVNMPGESGLDLLESISKELPDTATVMVTGVDDREVAERALKMGAYGYVIKPFQRNEILIGVSNALRRRELEIENRQHRARLEEKIQERTSHLWTALQEVEQAQEKLRASHELTIAKLSIAAEYRDGETALHVDRMSHYAVLLASKVGKEDEEVQAIRTASMMHDVGKIGVPDGILLKPGKLEPEEFDVIKTHCEIGHKILHDPSSELLQLAATIALTHHEWYDGSGYPHGLVGEAIPFEGRIAAIADVFDALTSNRVYRRALPLGEAIDIMTSERGTHLDPALLDLFLNSLDEVLALKDQPHPGIRGSALLRSG